MKEIVIDLFARHPELRDRHGIGERTAQACRELLIAHGRALAEQSRPLELPDDFTNADPFDADHE